MPPSPNRKAQTRREILQHAARLFRLRGYHATTIDDVMLAAGLTRGAFYAHFASKDALFAEIVRTGPGLLAQLRAGEPAAVLRAYLDKANLGETAQGCTLAALPGDVARAPLAARIAELARAKVRKLDGDATVAAILAVGAVTLARASGDARLGDWLLRSARRAALPLLKPRASPKRKRSKSRRKAAGARRSRRVAPSRGGRAAAAPKARSSAARR